MKTINRRTFLKQASMAGAAIALSKASGEEIEQREVKMSDKCEIDIYSTLAFQAAVASMSSIVFHSWIGNRTYPLSYVDLTYLSTQIYPLTKAKTSEKVTSCF